MGTAYIGLGANLGDPVAALRSAWRALNDLPGCRVTAASSLYRSLPVDSSGPDYINAVLQVATTLTPEQLLDGLQRIEHQHGRERPYRNAPRTLDLDLLLYGDLKVASSRLTVPHPRIAQRAFVLLPLGDVAPASRVPVDAQTARALAVSQGVVRLEQAFTEADPAA